jgi:hypothetical protein
MAPRYPDSYCRDSDDTFNNGKGSLDEVGVADSDVLSTNPIPTPSATALISSNLLFGIPVGLDGTFVSCWNALLSGVAAEALMVVITLCLRWDQALNVFGCMLLLGTKSPLKEDGEAEDEEERSLEHGLSVSMTVLVTEENE